MPKPKANSNEDVLKEYRDDSHAALKPHHFFHFYLFSNVCILAIDQPGKERKSFISTR
jgi:hypothetical protein